MTTYDLGDGVNLDHLVYDRDGALADATVALTVTKPDGSTLNPTVSRVSVGRYRAATFGADQVASWSGAWVVTGAVTDVASFAFLVADPAPGLYTSLPIVKRAIGSTAKKATGGSTGVLDDDLIDSAIRAASRRLDSRCGTRFWADRVPVARTVAVRGQSFSICGEQTLLVPAIASAAGLLVQSDRGGSWATLTGWEYGPDDALVDGRPITQLYGRTGWLPASGRVRITARWGWPQVPDEIAEAAKLLAARYYGRKDSTAGVLGGSEWGAIRVSRFDPDIEDLIERFTLPGIA